MKFSEFLSKRNAANEADDNVENYMFFGNLETIKRHAEMMLALNQTQVDTILKNGHSWAVDHIATSKDDMEEVCNFLQNETKEAGTGVAPNESVNVDEAFNFSLSSHQKAATDVISAIEKNKSFLKESDMEDLLVALATVLKKVGYIGLEDYK